MVMPATQRHWTVAAVRELIHEDRAWPRYELIDGELLVTPAPGDAHQFACMELIVMLQGYLAVAPCGVAQISPSDVPITPTSIVQPDVYVVPLYETNDGAAIEWPAERYLLLAVEVLSPSSLRTDRVTKRDLYLDHGVAEYWVIDLAARVIERWRPTQSTPDVFRDSITWTPRDDVGLSIDLPSFFDRVFASDRAMDRWRERR